MTALWHIAAVLLLGTTLQAAAVVDACPPDYTFIPTFNSCYRYRTDGINNWTAARDTCREEGAQLFYPESKEELEQVGILLNVGSFDYLNIGFSDLDKQGEYRTLDGRLVTRKVLRMYDKHPKEQRCGAISATNYDELKAIPCIKTQPFVCKRNSSATAEALQTANGEVRIIANTSDTLLQAMERQASVQSSLLERLVEIQQNQTVILEHLLKAAANQATASSRQSELVQRQSASLQRHHTDLLAAMGRLTANITAALEKLGSQDDNQQIYVRSDQ